MGTGDKNGMALTVGHVWCRCSELELTGEAMEAIGEFYAELRSKGDESALPITVRTLETVIRLSTAAAKARLSKGRARCSHRSCVAFHPTKEERRFCLSAGAPALSLCTVGTLNWIALTALLVQPCFSRISRLSKALVRPSFPPSFQPHFSSSPFLCLNFLSTLLQPLFQC